MDRLKAPASAAERLGRPGLGDALRHYHKHLKYLTWWPALAPRVIRNYFELLVRKRPRLRTVEFAVTYRCNAHCGHCSAANLEDPNRREFSVAEVKRIVAEGRALGLLNINFTGGESLLREDLEDMARACGPRSAVVSVATNGLLFTPERARSLARAGVRIVSISLDSVDPDTHDRFRGRPGLHAAALEAVESARRFGIEPFLCATISRSSLREGEAVRLVELADGLHTTITLQMACPVGRWEGAERHLLGPDEQQEYYALTRRPHVRWEGLSNYLAEGCPAGIEKLALTPYGDVLPCVFAHVSYGNLRDEPLETIWRRMISGPPFDRVHPNCPIGEDREFRERVLGPLAEAEQLPLPVEQHPYLCESYGGCADRGQDR